MTMADTVAVMNKGRIEQIGAPEELYELPRTAFVADFLGQSNLFATDVEGRDSTGLFARVAGRSVSVPLSRAQRTDGRITIGVRPEKLLLQTSEPEPAAGVNVLGPGRVTDVSFSGVSTQYQVTVPGLGVLAVFAQNLSFGPVVDEGAEVWLSWRVEHGFVLEDAPSGSNPRLGSEAMLVGAED